MKTITIFLSCCFFTVVLTIGVVLIQKPWLLERWFPSEEKKAQFQFKPVAEYYSAMSRLEGLITELPFLDDETLQMTQLEFEKRRMKQCGYPFNQPDNNAQQKSIECNRKMYDQRYNELSDQYKKETRNNHV